METLTIIGAGNVGKTLGRLWASRHLLEIRGVMTRTPDSACRAVQFIGQGSPVTGYHEISPTDWVMISVPDDQIESACINAAQSLRPGATVFHCSGSLSSSILEPARQRGCNIASVHPVKSFADPAASARTFDGTPCGIEGDEPACLRLEQLMVASGAQPFRVKSESKLLYHAGTVFVCNYLTALLEAGFRCYEASGIPRQQAVDLATSIIIETVHNNLKLGPAAALTGPIARGDAKLVSEQLKAVESASPQLADIYKALGLIAVELSQQKGVATSESLRQITQDLSR